MHLNNKFNIIFHMSASLPRIKTFHEVSRPSNTESQKDLKLKFRKLMLDGAENGDERKKSIKTLKTQRLKSLERYTTTQEQREFKNEKIHLNLIERKLLSGTYDEQKQTGNELNVLKQKRDQMKVEMNLKQREIERVKLLLEDVRQQIQGFMAKKGEYEEKLKEIKEKHEQQLAKTENARENRSVLENMIKAREQINIVLKKRHNQMKEGMGHLTSGINLMDNELRQINQKCAARESKLDQLMKTAVKERQERNNQISKHQEKINKRIEGQILQVQKSKKYISHLDQVQRQAQQRDFHGIYDKILANLFVAKYCKGKMLGLQQKYEIYESSYNRLTSYKSFDASNPKSLVVRFQEHQPENTRMQQEISQKEQLVSKLEVQQQELKKKKEKVIMESEQIDQQFLKSTLPLEVHAKQREQIEEAKKEVQQLQQKDLRIRTYILEMLKSLNQKGDKKIQSSIQASVTNLQLLTQVLREAYRQLQ